MTKDEAKKVIECAVCGDCERCIFHGDCDCSFETCEQHVHAAAKVIYGGNDMSERQTLAKQIFINHVSMWFQNATQDDIQRCFELADMFIKYADNKEQK